MLEVDRLLSRKQKILNTQKHIKFIDMPQWAKDSIIYINKKIEKLKRRKDDLILDPHNRLAHELVTSYDVIFFANL